MKKQNLHLVLVLTFLFVLGIPIQANDFSENDLKSNLPVLLGTGNAGKEYWFTIPPCFQDFNIGFSGFIRIYVTSQYQTNCVVEVPSKNYYSKKETKRNGVIEFIIEPSVGQPFEKSPYDSERPDEVFPDAGIHIVADDPIVVYVIVRYYYTSGGFLPIPVSKLGKKYIVSSYPVDPLFAENNYYLPGYVGIVAAYDKTTVQFTLGGNYKTQTAGGILPEQTVQRTLNKGDVWMISTKGSGSDLTGSQIVSDKPVAVVTGNECVNIPIGKPWCDYIVEMAIPTYSWGYNYHIPNTSKLPRRKYAPLLRILAKEKNTTLYRDGKEFGFLKSTNGMEGNGWVETRMNPEVPYTHYPVVISGDKPISVTLYNPSAQDDDTTNTNAYNDPFYMTIIPVEQYSKEILFCSPGLFESRRFEENYIGFIYQTDSTGNLPDNIELAEAKGGELVWKKMKDVLPSSYDIYSYDINGKKYAYRVFSVGTQGVYKIRAKQPFAAYSYGFSQFESYGYTSAIELYNLENPDTIPPMPIWQDSCNMVYMGTVTDMPNDSTIRSNIASIDLHPYPESFNIDFTYSNFEPGENSTVFWKLKVKDISKDARGVITFADKIGNDSTITIEYKASKLKIRENFSDWGVQQLNSKRSAKEFWIVNESTEQEEIVNYLKLKNGNQNFELDLLGKTLPFSIAPLDSVNFLVWFNPIENGTFLDSIGVGDSCRFIYQAQVKARVGEPYIEVTDVNFGGIVIGNTAISIFSIRNTGTADLHIWGYIGPNNTDVFTTDLPTKDSSNKMENELVIVPNGVMEFSVEFSPIAEENYSDSIVFFCNAKALDSVCLIVGKGKASSSVPNLPSIELKRPVVLGEVAPNPVTDNSMVIEFENFANQRIEVNIYNSMGSIVEKFTLEEIPTGKQRIIVNTSNFSNGTYLVEFRNSRFRSSKLVVIMK
jgi:hypothetical protein